MLKSHRQYPQHLASATVFLEHPRLADILRPLSPSESILRISRYFVIFMTSELLFTPIKVHLIILARYDSVALTPVDMALFPRNGGSHFPI